MVWLGRTRVNAATCEPFRVTQTEIALPSRWSLTTTALCTISVDSRHRGKTTNPFDMDGRRLGRNRCDGMKGLHLPCHAKTTYVDGRTHLSSSSISSRSVGGSEGERHRFRKRLCFQRTPWFCSKRRLPLRSLLSPPCFPELALFSVFLSAWVSQLLV